MATINKKLRKELKKMLKKNEDAIAKIGSIFLISVLALASTGVSYALWSETININGTVTTGSVNIEFRNIVCGDSEIPEKDAASYIEAIPDKVDGNTLVVTIHDAYPCITYTVDFDLYCAGNVPVHFTGFDINYGNCDPSWITFTGLDALDYRYGGPQMHQYDSAPGKITIHLDNTATQGTTYTFSATATAGQYNEYPLQHTLTMDVTGGGTTNPGVGTHTYYEGVNAIITASDDSSWAFDHWTGDVPPGDENDNPLTITMDTDKAVEAHFTHIEYTLTVTVVGTGCSVGRDSPGPYYYGDSVQLTANAATGWHFVEWSVDLTGSTSPGSVTMTSNKAVTATFARDGPYDLTVTVVGTGCSVIAAPGTAYYYGDVVTLTPSPATGWTFDHWSGSNAGDLVNNHDGTWSITMNGAKSVTAHFAVAIILDTNVNSISSSVASSPKTITANGDPLLSSVALWYRWSDDGISWNGGLNEVKDPVDSNTCDVDGNADKGIETDFANAQDIVQDSNYMTIQEADQGVILNENKNYVDAQSSLHLPTTDIGTHSSFAEMQDRDGIYDTLAEAITPAQVTFQSTGTGSGSNSGNPTPSYPTGLALNDLILLQVILRRDDSSFTITPPSGFALLYGPDTSGSGDSEVRQWIYYKFSDGTESGTATVTFVNCYGTRTAMMYAFRNVALTSFTEGAAVLTDYDDVIDAPTITTTGNGRLAVAFISIQNDISLGSFSGESGGDWTEATEYPFNGDYDICMQLQTATMATGGTISGGSYDTGSTNYNWIARGVALKPMINNYRLDLEVGWTTADYDETNEYLCIYGGTQDSEALQVDVWNGAWTNVISDLSAGWNNVSVSSYLTSSNFEIRFVDALQSSDTSQSSWQVEGVLLHTWSVGTNYQIDFEYQWTAAVHNMANAQVCIYVGSHTGSEDLLVNYWTGSAWSPLPGTITGTGPSWFDFTATGLASSTYTIQLKGATETGDTSSDSWNIDAITLRTWDTSGGPHGHNWMIWSNASNPDLNGADGWSWSFNFPDGLGYYEFYSIGKYGLSTETAPGTADASCHFVIDTYVNDIIPYEVTSSPHTITATGASGLNNVTLWYRWSSYVARTSGGTITAQSDGCGTSSPSGEEKDKAFDNDVNTKWLDFCGTDGQSWITYHYGTGESYGISKYSITSANDFPERDPKNWYLKGSNDGSTWTTVDTQAGIQFTSRYQTKTFDIDGGSAGSYSYYKLDITDVWDAGSADSVQLAEIELYEYAAGSWNAWSSSGNNPDTDYGHGGWNWSFNFPNGEGYYEFYSIGRSGGDTEAAPGSADASCHYTLLPISVILRPDAAGSTTQLTRNGGSANYDRVDEVTADDSTTYVYGDGYNSRQTDTYNVLDQTLTGTITNVRIYIRADESSSNSNVYAWTAIRIGTGSIQYGTQIGTTTSWTNYYTDYPTKTGNLGSGAWTWADINNLQIGVGLQSTYSSGWRYARCTQVWVEVNYTP